jgi:predicted site-specific integrase-resolvase
VSRKCNTTEAAEAVGIDRITLQRWIRLGKVEAPEAVIRGGRAVRLWTRADIKRLRETKEQLYRKGQGRRTDLKAKR